MSLSTLPEIFKDKISRSYRPSKIGGVFSLHLTNNNSPETSTTSLSKRQLKANTGRSQISTKRSSSSKALSKKMSNLNSQNQLKTQKIGSFQQSIVKRRSSQSAFSKDVSALQEIYYKNIIKSKIAPQINNWFPYQTSRTMNNMGINMQEADSMKNRLQLIQQNIQNSCYSLQHNKSCIQQIHKQLSVIKVHFQDNLKQINSQFSQLFGQCYKKLSKSRRQTNQQIKVSKKELEGIIYEIQDASQVYKILEDRSNKMRNDCIQDEKLQYSRNSTYFKQILSTQQKNFVEPFNSTKHKRASSIKGTRNNMAEGYSEQNRVSTTSKGRRFIKNENIKQESQGEQNLYQGIQNVIYRDLNTKFPYENGGIILNGKHLHLIQGPQDVQEMLYDN